MEIMWIHLWINGLVFFPHLKHLTSNVEHPEIVSMRLNEQENRGIEPILHFVLPIDRRSHQVNRVPGAILDSRILVVLLLFNQPAAAKTTGGIRIEKVDGCLEVRVIIQLAILVEQVVCLRLHLKQVW